MKAEIGTLSKRTAKAGVWMAGARLAGKAVDFVALIVLARFLGPTDFGLVAMAMTLIFIVEAIMELPLAAAMLRVPDPNADVYATAFTLGLLRGLFIGIFFLICAWPLSYFYSEPRLVPLVMSLALAPAMRGCISPRMVDYNRRMDFRRQAVLEVASKLVAMTAAIAMAIVTHSYWSIALGTILVPAVSLLGSYALAPMRPRFSLKEWPVFADILTWNMMSQILAALNWQVDRLVLPPVIPPAVFGRYAMANDLSVLPFQALSTPLYSPLNVAFVSAHQHGVLEKTYLKATFGIFVLMGPILCFCGIMADPLIRIFLGAQWAQAAPILTALALANLGFLPAVPMAPLAVGLNQSRQITLRNLIGCAVRVPITIIGVLTAGVAGVVVAKIIATVVMLILAMMAVRTMIGISLRNQCGVLAGPSAALLISGVFLAFIAMFIHADGDIVMNLFRLATAGILYVVAYIVAVYAISMRFGDVIGISTMLNAIALRAVVRLKA